MSNSIRLALHAAAVAALAIVAPHPSDTAKAGAPCHTLAAARDRMSPTGTWIELNNVQRAFVAGVFAVSPTTRPGLPFGDKAAVARRTSDSAWTVLWLDGDLVCEPMEVPTVVYEMILTIGLGTISHEGTEN